MPALKFQIKRKCEMCGATFIAKTLESKYCSKHCIDMAYKQKKAAANRICNHNNAVVLVAIHYFDRIFPHYNNP